LCRALSSPDIFTQVIFSVDNQHLYLFGMPHMDQ
jgi:hypothetical protein